VERFWKKGAALVLGLILFCTPKPVLIVMETDLGSIVVEVDKARAPITASNFLRHVDEGRFDGAVFYRVVRPDNQPSNPVKIDVIQGGLDVDEGPYEPIPHETTAMTRIRHQDGVISMARNKPGSASSEFFICIGNQPELDFKGRRNPDGQGFAAFGRVKEGMDVVRRILVQPAMDQRLDPPIRILSVRRIR
jgi:peptidyl-prolyl cis-trans isomerase A (cyclophilin A)